ncbi:MAG: hypothetical protein AAGF88_07860 [Pseudomonadota bacterium]
MHVLRCASLAAVTSLMFTMAPSANANEPTLSFALSAAHHDRNGPDVDDDEGDRFQALRGMALGAFDVGPARLQFNLLADTNDNHDEPFYSDDFSGRHVQGAFHAGLPTEWGYAGVFAAANRAWYNANNEGQNTSSLGFGLSGAYHAETFSLYGAIGRFEVIGTVVDGETINDAEVVSAGGRYFFTEERAIGVDLAYANAISDFDVAVPDDLDIFEITFSYEHGLNRPVFGGDASVFVEASRVFIDELVLTGVGSTTARETRLALGLRVSFGSQSVQDRYQSTAPPLPNVGRWQAMSAVID